jgi:hypothetical protein
MRPIGGMLVLDTAAWEQLDLAVLTDIHLDPKNVRLETADATIEADILEDLFANEKYAFRSRRRLRI